MMNTSTAIIINSNLKKNLKTGKYISHFFLMYNFLRTEGNGAKMDNGLEGTQRQDGCMKI